LLNDKIVKFAQRITKEIEGKHMLTNKTDEEDYEDRNLNTVKQKARLVNQRERHSGNPIKLLSA